MTKARLTEQAPVLLVKDMTASLVYWQEKLGFKGQTWGDPPGFAILTRDGCHIMLSLVCGDHDIVPNWKIVNQMWNAYFWVDDAAALYEEFTASGAKIDYHLGKKDYGVLEFGIQDLDEHDIAFGQILD